MIKGMEKLQTLLTSGGGELVNVKFFPGNGRGVTADQMAEAACELLACDRENLSDNPPKSGLVKASHLARLYVLVLRSKI